MNCLNCPVFKKSIFKNLPAILIDNLELQKKVISVNKGEYVFKNGEPVDAIYCLMTSMCKITQREDSQNNEAVVRIAGLGDVVGYRSVFHRETYLGSAIAIEKGTICQIPKSALLKLIESSPNLSIELLSKLSIEISRSEKRIHYFHKLSVRERLMDVLLILASEIGLEGDNGKIILKIPLTRKEFSSLVPASMENVVRTISDLKKEGLIEELDDGALIINTIEMKKAF
jgi:CRP-like cAMP-binding protein